MTRSTVLALLLLLGLASPTHPQDAYRAILDRQMSAVQLDDDAPVLEFTSPANGLHTLWVTMYACSIEPCSFAYKVFRR